MTPRELLALEKRLEKEPDNLPLRITLAGHLREAGRVAEAVELYRSVAIAYRSQGRKGQAIAVCRSVLELAPDDAGCRTLLAELTDPTTPPAAPGVFAPKPKPRPAAVAAPQPPRDSTTPLPKPLPYHVHDPTTSSIARISRRDVDLPPVEGADTRPGDEDRGADTTGLAEAARQISGLIAGDPRPQPPRPTDFDEAPTPTPVRPPKPSRPMPVQDGAPARDTDEDLTTPRERVGEEPLANALFALLPAGKRDEALRRCSERALRSGEPAIRAGETSHPLVLVVSGRLEVRLGARVLESVEPGGFVGEASLLARAPAPHAVIAAEDSVVLALPAHAVFELAGTYPKVWAALKDSAERRTRSYAPR